MLGCDMKKQKTCFDCLHCKVSATSTKNSRLCFCAVSAVREDHDDTYWFMKPLCGNFFNMAEKPMAVVILPAIALKRKPLLRNRMYV
jgi:hypothetical protein